jgi:hypothetical protein
MVSRDSVSFFWGIGGISGHSGLMSGVGGDWGCGEGLWNEVGRLGLGACQFGLSKHFGFRTGGSLWGGGSLQLLEWLNWG